MCLLLPLPVCLQVELSYAPPPGFQQSFAQCPGLPQFLHVSMSVELVRFPLWCWFLPLPFLIPFLRESTCILSSSALVPFPDDALGFAPKFREEYHHCNKAARRAVLLAIVPNRRLFLRKFGAIFIITVYLTASANGVPEARSHSPTSSSQDLKPDSKPSVWSQPGFRRHHDLLHQSVLSVLSVWRVSTVHQSPCLCSIGFLNGSDQGS